MSGKNLAILAVTCVIAAAFLVVMFLTFDRVPDDRKKIEKGIDTLKAQVREAGGRKQTLDARTHGLDTSLRGIYRRADTYKERDNEVKKNYAGAVRYRTARIPLLDSFWANTRWPD